MSKSTKKFLASIFTLLVLVVPAFLFAGCNFDSGSGNSNLIFASTKTIKSAVATESREECNYIEVQVSSEEERVTISASDFKYVQNGKTKTASNFLGRYVVKQETKNGVTVDVSYYDYAKTRDVVTSSGYGGVIVTLKLVVEDNASVSKLLYKGKEITRNEIVQG